MKYDQPATNPSDVPIEENITTEDQSAENIAKWEDLQNAEAPEVPEDVENTLEELSPEGKEAVRQAINEMPMTARQEIAAAVVNQVNLLKELGTGLKDKIDWSKVDRKKALTLGAYAAISIAGGFMASNAEASENTADNLDDLSPDYLESTLRTAVGELGSIENLSNDEGGMFLHYAFEVAKVYDENNVEGARINFERSVSDMIDWIKWAKDNDADIHGGLNEILEIASNFAKQNKVDTDTTSMEIAPTDTVEITFTDIPERETLEFADKYTELERMKFQEHHDNLVTTVNLMSEEFEYWKLEYSHKDNFTEFQDKVGQWINLKIAEMNEFSERVKNPNIDLEKTSMSGPEAIETEIHFVISRLADETNIRTFQEKFQDEIDRVRSKKK